MAMSNFRRLAGNVTSLLTSEVVNRATTFVLYAMISRYLGTHEFGQLTLAFSLIVIAQFFAGAGLKVLINREVAKDRTKTKKYLINASALVVVGSLISILGLALFVRLMDYSSETSFIILLLSLGVLPFSLSVISKAIFRAWERMHYIVWANAPVNIIKVGAAFLLLWMGYGLVELILLLLASYVVILLIEWWLMAKFIVKPHFSIDRTFGKTMLHSTAPFLGITLIIAINGNIDAILLSKFTDEANVGLFGSAVQLVTPFVVVFETVVLSVFPEMSRRFVMSVESQKRFSDFVLELLLAIALPAVVGLVFLAEPVILLLWGNPDFVSATILLQIMAWSLIFWTFQLVLGRLLVASLMEKVTLRIVIVITVLKLLLGYVLIIQYGVIGAAITGLVISFANFVLHNISVSKRLFRIQLHKLAWKPAVASAFMAIWLIFLQNQQFLLVVVSACVIYGVVLFILMIWSNGGVRQARHKYQSLWTKQRM